jgi:hypothetical protein
MEAATATRTVTFVAPRHRNLEVIVTNGYRTAHRNPGGDVIGYETKPGKTARFENWKCVTDDQEMIDYLRQHDLFLDGSEPQLREALIAGRKSRGFYEAYDANRPNVEERLMQIADFAADGELEGLQAIVADETSFGDGGREQVLDSARNQIVKIEERQRIIQKIEADAEADAESEPPEGGTPSEDNEGTDDARDSGD